MKIEIKNGVIFNEENKVIDCLFADIIARANNFLYAERFVGAYKDKKLILDENFKIVKEVI